MTKDWAFFWENENANSLNRVVEQKEREVKWVPLDAACLPARDDSLPARSTSMPARGNPVPARGPPEIQSGGTERLQGSNYPCRAYRKRKPVVAAKGERPTTSSPPTLVPHSTVHHTPARDVACTPTVQWEEERRRWLSLEKERRSPKVEIRKVLPALELPGPLLAPIHDAMVQQAPLHYRQPIDMVYKTGNARVAVDSRSQMNVTPMLTIRLVQASSPPVEEEKELIASFPYDPGGVELWEVTCKGDLLWREVLCHLMA